MPVNFLRSAVTLNSGVTLFGCLAISCLLGGCAAESDSGTAGISPQDTGTAVGTDLTASLILSEMPEGEVASPTDIKELGGTETSTILAGRIDAGDMDPFQPGEIAFMISQLPEEGHGDEDPEHADNCPFCARKLKNAPKAIVQFRGADGNVLVGDPRLTLSLQKGDVVYVAGVAQYNPAVNTVIVNASGVFRTSKR